MENLEQVLTLETLPKAFTLLTNEVSEIKRLLQQKTEPQTATDRWFDLNELCIYLPDEPSKATVYAWVHTGLIPCHKGQKKLRFLKSEIDAWLLTGRKKTLAETAREADAYLKEKEVAMPKMNNPQHKRQAEDNTPYNQLQTIFQYLQEHIATASMIADVTGVYQKNICRYKRDLEKAGRLWELYKKPCSKTGFKAWYLTTDPTKAQKDNNQLNLFPI